jgi:hypothetical protein
MQILRIFPYSCADPNVGGGWAHEHLQSQTWLACRARLKFDIHTFVLYHSTRQVNPLTHVSNFAVFKHNSKNTQNGYGNLTCN